MLVLPYVLQYVYMNKVCHCYYQNDIEQTGVCRFSTQYVTVPFETYLSDLLGHFQYCDCSSHVFISDHILVIRSFHVIENGAKCGNARKEKKRVAKPSMETCMEERYDELCVERRRLNE